MVRQEWKKLFHNKILLLVVIAVIVIPSIYTTLFLGSMWDPYGKTDQLPVAVVNKDQPASYGGKQIKIGEELTEELKKNDSLDFRFMDEDKAQKQLKDGSCYMVITIPENFSANAATLTQDQPKKMELSYETNPGTNYIASKMSETAMKELQSSVREEVTKVYTRVMFDSILEAGDGMEDAAQGAETLGDGVSQAADGNKSITENLALLADSTLTFKGGAGTLNEGLKTYTDAMQTAAQGAGKLADGTKELSTASGQLEQGAASLESGANDLTNGLQQIVGDGYGQSQALADGSRQLSDGLAAFSTALGQASSTDVSSYAQQLKGAAASLSGTPELSDPQALAAQIESAKAAGDTEALAQLAEQALQAAQANYESGCQMSSQISGAAEALNNAGDALAGISSGNGMQTLAAQAQVLSQKSQALADGIQAYTTGVNTAADGSRTLSQGVETLTDKLSQAKTGIEALDSGARELSQGSRQLTQASPALLQGAGQLESGAGQISDGAGQLYDGSSQLGEGIAKLQDGTKTLSGSLSEGAQEIHSTKSDDNVVDMFAAPVDSKETQVTNMPNNGHAMAPYMMSVGLWVGCIAFSLMYPLNSYSGKLRSGKSWWRSKASVLYTVAIAQALVMLGALHLFDGFQPADWPMTILTACLASLAFMSVMYFFTNLLGKVGSFLMLVFMVIQLAGSVGTYPLEVSGDFVPYLHGWVPFTYTVTAFRSTISGGEDITGCLVFLLVLFLVFSVLTLLEFQIRTRRIEAKKPLLMDWLETHGLA